MEALYGTINQRRRPEDVAQMILDTLDDSLTLNERRVLDRAAAGSLKRALTNQPRPTSRSFRRSARALSFGIYSTEIK